MSIIKLHLVFSRHPGADLLVKSNLQPFSTLNSTGIHWAVPIFAVTTVGDLNTAVAKAISAAESIGSQAASAGAAGLRNVRAAKVVPRTVLGVTGRANLDAQSLVGAAGSLQLLHIQHDVGTKGVDVHSCELSVHDLDVFCFDRSAHDQDGEQGRDKKREIHCVLAVSLRV